MSQIKVYLDDNLISRFEIEAAVEGDYVPRFNQRSLQRIIYEIDQKVGSNGWTSFEYLKKDSQ